MVDVHGGLLQDFDHRGLVAGDDRHMLAQLLQLVLLENAPFPLKRIVVGAFRIIAVGAWERHMQVR